MAEPEIRGTTIFAESPRALMKMNTRYGYLAGYENAWKERVRFRMYFVILGLLGIYLLFVNPMLSVFAFGASTYFWQLYDHRGMVVGSTRRIIQAM